jgi:hypothetical protein
VLVFCSDFDYDELDDSGEEALPLYATFGVFSGFTDPLLGASVVADRVRKTLKQEHVLRKCLSQGKLLSRPQWFKATSS